MLKYNNKDILKEEIFTEDTPPGFYDTSQMSSNDANLFAIPDVSGLTEEAVNEGAIGDFVKSIKNKINQFVSKQRNKKREAEKRKKDSAKHVSKKELIAERELIKNNFHKILNKYPDLKKRFSQVNNVIEDETTPDEYYWYNVVYGAIYVDDIEASEFSPELKSEFGKFTQELKSSMSNVKYHIMNVEPDDTCWIFQVKDNGEIVVSLESVHECTYVYSILSEGVIGDFVSKIKAKIKAKIEENNKARHEKQKANDKSKREAKLKQAPRVSKEELIEERVEFTKTFYSTLNKYPLIKKNFTKQNELYEDTMTVGSEYDYNIVFGEIYGDIDEEEFSEKLQSQLDKFHEELKPHSKQMKHHDFLIEDQVDYIYYQLVSDSFNPVVVSEVVNEGTTVYHLNFK